MSEVSTYRPYIASIMHDNMNPAMGTVVDYVSSLDIQFCCFLPYAHPLFMTSSFLSFSNIRYVRLFLRCSYLSS